MSEKWVRRMIYAAIGVVMLILAWIIWNKATGYWLENEWFSSLGFDSVFWKILGSKWGIWLVASLLASIWFAIQITLASRFVRKHFSAHLHTEDHKDWEKDYPAFPLGVGIVATILALLAFGPWAHSNWPIFLKYYNQVPFGQKDPVFGLDLSFYIFSMPYLQFIAQWLLVLSLASLMVVVIFYLIIDGKYRYQTYDRRQESSYHVTLDDLWHRSASSHLAVLVGLFFLAFAYWINLQKYALLYNPAGVVVGAGYTDIHIRMAVYLIFAWVSVVLALACWTTAVSHRWQPSAWVFGSWIVAYAVMVGIVPLCMQMLVVRPNELQREKPYITRNIAYTKKAFGLAEVVERQFPADENLTFAQIQANQATTQNIRLWDYRPLQNTLKQMQELRLYYDFPSIDIDRYRFGGQYRQVMLSPRELNIDKLPSKAQQWVPMTLQYTHGYGLCLAPVNVITDEGRPQLWIGDMPIRSWRPDFPKVKQPQIYYGELTDNTVYVNSGTDEIDHPIKEDFAKTKYQGKGGIPIGSGVRKLALAYQFDLFNILLSKYIKPQTKVLWRRNIAERVREIAPFLSYDWDPYLVIGKDGRLWWIYDAYTTADTYPYSENFSTDSEGFEELNSCNYIRNSIKVVVNAYDGSVSFYIVDTHDPIAKTWRRVFPKLFKPIGKMPADLREHLRYPEQLFLVQAHLYCEYHMKKPGVFYTKEDRWNIAEEVYGDPNSKQEVEPYYVIMRMPGEKKEEFVLMLPFTPQNKPNMIAWMAARCDQPHYGQIQTFLFPKGKFINGTIQVENRIDQDEEISKSLTLWGQHGSRVIRGNTLVIPIEDSLLYVEPLYLQATAGTYPELKKVIVANQRKLIMADTLQEALEQLYTTSSVSSGIETAGSKQKTKTTSQLISEATAHFKRAEQAAAKGQWGRQGAELEAVKNILTELEKQQSQ